MIFMKATNADLEGVTKLYDDICDYLNEHTNYPGWKKDIYPTKEDAEAGINENTLYVCKCGSDIAGTVILRHKPEDGYRDVNWLTKSDYSKIYVIYTLAVHPNYFGSGIGKFILESVEKQASDEGCISLRLDVVKGNTPAENLYRKCNYQFITTKSLGYEMYGLPWYNLYERVLEKH